MSYLVIILGIIVVILIYYIYAISISAPIVATNLYLKNNPTAIEAAKITNPTTTTYTVGVWVYINNFSNNIGTFLLFGNKTNSLTTAGPLFALRMESTAPIMKVNIAGSNAGQPPTMASMNTMTLTNNFPLQSWTYVTVSVSNYYADLYLNGKLVVSSKLTYPSAASSGNDAPSFSFGSNSPDMYITGLARWPQPLDPQSIWTYYSQGNGNTTGMFGSTYSMDISLKRDNNTYNYPIF